MRSVLVALAISFVAASGAWAQDPCAALLTEQIVDANSQTYARFEDYQSSWTDVRIAIFFRGADPEVDAPWQFMTTPKSVWVPVLMTTACYEAASQAVRDFVANVDFNVHYDLRVRWFNSATGLFGSWSNAQPFTKPLPGCQDHLGMSFDPGETTTVSAHASDRKAVVNTYTSLGWQLTKETKQKSTSFLTFTCI